MAVHPSMSTRRRPKSVRPGGRVRFGTVSTLSAALVATVLSVPTLVQAAPPDPSGAGESPVPVSPVPVSKTKAPAMPLYTPPPAAWPAGGTGAVAVDRAAGGAARAVGAGAARPGGLGVVARSSAADPDRDPRTPA